MSGARAFYNEIDPFCGAWLERLSAAGHIVTGDVDTRGVRDVRAVDLDAAQCHFFAGLGAWSYALRLAGWPDDRPVWTGSCPCQPFSVSGRRRGVLDERHLWPAWRALIAERRPPILFGEQVASPDGRTWLDAVFADLEDLGYAVGGADLCAAGVGAPHIRQRLYFVGVLEELADPGGDERGQRRKRAEVPRGSESGISAVEPAGCGDAGVVGNTHGERSQVGPVADDGPRALRIEGQAVRAAGVVGDAWSDADLLYCADGSYRPVGPGSFPLAHGASARVGRLRAYGNAIVPQVAAAFIGGVMDVLSAQGEAHGDAR